MAGSLKRGYPDVDEDLTLIRALVDSNVPKFLADDLPLFAAIVKVILIHRWQKGRTTDHGCSRSGACFSVAPSPLSGRSYTPASLLSGGVACSCCSSLPCHDERKHVRMVVEKRDLIHWAFLTPYALGLFSTGRTCSLDLRCPRTTTASLAWPLRSSSTSTASRR